MSTSLQNRPKTSAMIASIAEEGQRTASAPFGHALARLADENPAVVGLSADLAKYTDMHVFRDRHPDRFFQVGMAEQLLLGAAALGVLFLVIKAREYAVEIGAGFTIDTDAFFLWYYLLTGFHAAHVVAGVILLVLSNVVRKGPDRADAPAGARGARR